MGPPPHTPFHPSPKARNKYIFQIFVYLRIKMTLLCVGAATYDNKNNNTMISHIHYCYYYCYYHYDDNNNTNLVRGF